VSGMEEITRRLKRVEGQVRGLQRMVEGQRDCEAILTQLMAARAALDRVGLLIAGDFLRDCALNPDGSLARERVERVLELLFSRFSAHAVHAPSSVDAELLSLDPIEPFQEE
jgi:DNA-binding FrmR family transcriptional regulator